MKKFVVSLTERSIGNYTPSFYEVADGDDLLEVLSKLILIIARLHKKLLDEEQIKDNNDDIPF